MAWLWLIIVDLASLAAFVFLILRDHPYAAIVPGIVLFAASFTNKEKE